jgi:hypothetical protein
MADIEAKTALVDVIPPTETYPPQDLAKWLTTKAITKSQMEGEKQRKEGEKANQIGPKTQKDWEERTKSLSSG